MTGRPAIVAGNIMMTSPFVEKLRRLTDLTAADLEQIADICEPLGSASAHTDLVKEGEHSEFLHLVLDGWACRYPPSGGWAATVPRIAPARRHLRSRSAADGAPSLWRRGPDPLQSGARAARQAAGSARPKSGDPTRLLVAHLRRERRRQRVGRVPGPPLGHRKIWRTSSANSTCGSRPSGRFATTATPSRLPRRSCPTRLASASCT